MDKYIDRFALGNAMTIAAVNGKDRDRRIWAKAICLLHDMPTEDVTLVVRCKDCKYSWEDLSGLCCSYGVCVDCTVPDDFYCAYAIRKEGK